jgi:hypothetical protein
MTKDIGGCEITRGGTVLSFQDPYIENRRYLLLDVLEPQPPEAAGKFLSVTFLQLDSFEESLDSYEMMFILRITGRPNEYCRIGCFFPDKSEIPR